MQLKIGSYCIALSFFFSIPPYIIGQPYLPLSVENATWIMVHGENDFTINYYYAFKVEGDTMFNGLAYKKVYLLGLTDDTIQYTIASKQLYALMRDDVPNSKTYAVMFTQIPDMELCTTDPPSEVLLYDFNLSIGDTVSDCRLQSVHPEYRYTIDTIYTQDTLHELRRVWHTAYSISLFEGVGYSRGLFTEASGVTHAAYGTYLIDYCIGTNFECGLYTATSSIDKRESAWIFPNPVEDVLYLKSEFAFENTCIYTLTGHRVIQRILTDSQSIPISDLPPGMYIIQLHASNTGIVSARFFKE